MKKEDLLKEIAASFATHRMLMTFSFVMSGVFIFIVKTPIPVYLLYVQAAWFISSFGFWEILKRQRTVTRINLVHFSWYVIEVIAMAFNLNSWGGATWVGVIFYTFLCAFGVFLLPNKGGMTLLAAAVTSFSVEMILEYLQVIPHYPFITDITPHLNTNYVTITVLFMQGYFGTLFFTINLFARRFREKTNKLSDLAVQLEEANTVLEIKIKARTRELEELNKNLDAKVQEKTKELQEKIGEMEKMNEYMVGRELRMVELKEQISSMKSPTP